MGFFRDYFGFPEKATNIQESKTVDLGEHHSIVNELLQENLALQESNGMQALKLEDYMWVPVSGWQSDQGFSLRTIQEESDHCRALYAVNPLIKKAVTARTGMIHGRGYRIKPANETGTGQARIDKIMADNKRKIFGDVAQARLEAELSSTGNVFVLRERNKPAVVIPIYQLSGYVTDVDDPSQVLYWKRNYSTMETDVETGNTRQVVVSEYIPAVGNNSPVPAIGQDPVRTSARMVHLAANKQESWVLGLPDVFAAKFWTKGHKEMFEAGHEFALAQGQIAAKVTGGSALGTQLAASRLADQPRRDPETGEIYGYGGTFVGSQGMDYQLMGKMGSGVDFGSYDRIAGLIAAGTGVPLKVLLAESDSEETSLEQTTVEDMKMRQKLWGEFFEDFFSVDKVSVQVIWPRIKQETVYRVQQAVEISNRTNTLTADEKRLLTLEAWGLEGDSAKTPTIEEHPDVMVYRAKKEIDLEYAEKIAAASSVRETEEPDDGNRSTVNDQGNDQKLGKLSDGKDAHDARDAGEQEHTR